MKHDAEPPHLARRPAAVTVVVASALFVVIAVVLVPWSWVPGGHITPMPAAHLFSHPEIARADRFSSEARLLSLGGYFLSIIVALVLGLTPLGARLMRKVAGRVSRLAGSHLNQPWWVTVVLGTLLLQLIGQLLVLPLSLELRNEELRFDLTRQPLGGWASDQVKSLLVAWVGTALLLLVLIGLARRSPRYWFAWAGAAAVLLTVAGSFLYPVLVEPLFNKFTPLQAGPFRAAVFRLAAKEGVHISDVLVANASQRTTTVNAYVSGFGSTRRVVIYDNLLKDLTPAEAKLVVAHELGHAKHNDVVTGTILGAVGSVVGVGLLALLLDSKALQRRTGIRGPGDPAAVALILALAAVGGFLVSPVQNTISRAIEARADRTAIETTGQGQAFVRMQRQIAVRALNDPNPPAITQFWFGSHPTAVQRAGMPASLRAASR